jgi:hypothetical protein
MREMIFTDIVHTDILWDMPDDVWLNWMTWGCNWR